MLQSARGLILLLAGTFLLVAALHGLVNVTHLREDLLEINVRPTLLRAVSLVLYLSVVAMLAFSALVLSAAVDALRGRRSQPASLWIIAATYAAFGIFAYLFVVQSIQTLGYTLMGLLVALGAGWGSRRLTSEGSAASTGA